MEPTWDTESKGNILWMAGIHTGIWRLILSFAAPHSSTHWAQHENIRTLKEQSEREENKDNIWKSLVASSNATEIMLWSLVGVWRAGHKDTEFNDPLAGQGTGSSMWHLDASGGVGQS